MDEHLLPDVVHRAVPTAGHRLAGLICTGYGSIADCREGIEQQGCDSYAVVLVHGGSGGIETAAMASRLTVEAGNLLWLFPGVAYTCMPSSEGMAVQWATFTGPLAESFELLGWLARAHPVVRPDDPGQVATLFSQLRADFVAGGPLVDLLGAALIHRLAVVAHRSNIISAPAPLGRALALPWAVALIQANALRPLDPHAIADECGIGYSTLRRRFKQVTGQSITGYLLRVRLDRARELMAHTRMSVAQVAEGVGFADPYYFSRVFHREEGLTPTAFRAREQASG